MANSFSQDGAAGAGNNLGANSGSAGFGNPGFNNTQMGVGTSTGTGAGGDEPFDTENPGAINTSNAPRNVPFTPQPAPPPLAAGAGSGQPSSIGGGFGPFESAPSGGASNPTSLNSSGGMYPGMMFAEGGAVPTDVDDTNGSPGQDAISKALDSADAVLAYGRKLHGLGGGQDESGGAIQGAPAPQQMAAGYGNGRMPMVPGNQSNSGAPPIQPQPGALPPTANPFGKRADASQPDSDGDNDGDNGGAIDTEETA